MSDDLSANEKKAFPFLESAIRLDQAKQTPDDLNKLRDALDQNVAMWLLLKNHYLNTGLDVPMEMITHIIQFSNFTVKAAITIQRHYDDSLMDHLINMNLNMCEIQLSATGR